MSEARSFAVPFRSAASRQTNRGTSERSTEAFVAPASAAPVSEVSVEEVSVEEDVAEALIVDCRARLRPAAMVENKLLALLNGSALPVSHLRLSSLAAGHGRTSSTSAPPDPGSPPARASRDYSVG